MSSLAYMYTDGSRTSVLTPRLPSCSTQLLLPKGCSALPVLQAAPRFPGFDSFQVSTASHDLLEHQYSTSLLPFILVHVFNKLCVVLLLVFARCLLYTLSVPRGPACVTTFFFFMWVCACFFYFYFFLRLPITLSYLCAPCINSKNKMSY